MAGGGGVVNNSPGPAPVDSHPPIPFPFHFRHLATPEKLRVAPE
jgi:hypothetical protein